MYSVGGHGKKRHVSSFFHEKTAHVLATKRQSFLVCSSVYVSIVVVSAPVPLGPLHHRVFLKAFFFFREKKIKIFFRFVRSILPALNNSYTYV